MPNANTEHSRQLRAKTASARKQRIIDEGGYDLRVLLEKEDHEKLKCIVEWYRLRDDTSQRAVMIRMIKDAYAKLPINARLHTDQLDAFTKPPEAHSNHPPCRYKLDDNYWSGRGRKPLWVINYLESGGNLEDLRISHP